MDDLEQKLSSLLADPAAMERVGSLLRSLGADDAPPEPAESTAPTSPPAPSLESLLPLLTSAGKENPNTALLQALRPYLHGEREKRLDDALHLLRLTELLPLLNRP